MVANVATGEQEYDPFADIAQTEHIGLGDLIISAVLAVVTFTLLAIWSYPIPQPALWNDIAVSAGLRPASHLVGGYYVAFASALYSVFGLEVGNVILTGLGRIALAGIAVVAYAALREMLAFIMRARPQRSKRRSLVMKVASIVGTMAFVCSDPVWRAGQTLSETTILIALAMMSLEFFFVFIRKGALKYAYLCALFLGLLSAESIAGFALLFAFLLINNVVLKLLPVFESPFFKPAVMAVSKWYMTFIFVLAILIGAGINCWSYVAHDALVVTGQSAGELAIAYMNGYSARVSAAAPIGGWLLWFGVCFAPFIVAMVRFPGAADEETFLSYATGIVFLICGLIAFTQVSPVQALWFWKYFPVNSDFMLAMGMVWVATTLAAAVTIMGVDSVCRNHARLAKQIFGADEETDQESDPSLGSPASTIIRRTGVILIPTILVLAMLPGRMQSKTREILKLVDDGLTEIVEEAKDAKYLFTDGNLDVGIELRAYQMDKDLICLPLVSRTASSDMDVYLRTRGMQGDAEDLFSFKFDVGMGLRSWIRDRPQHLEKSAVMMGFDLWKRDGKALPPFGGMLSHPCGWASEELRKLSIANSYALADRIFAIYEMEGEEPPKDVKDALLSLQWRIARMCTYRGEQADLAGDAELAIKEADTAKRLNGKNETYQNVLTAMSRQNDLMMSRLTPREGLQLALVRADFAMGKMYAETILVADPENADANFAMGMFYVKERQLTRGEEYLKRCLIRRPNEPSIYNNLAMIEMELGKLDAAEINAKKALAIIPDSVAVKDTLKLIKAKREGKADDAAQDDTQGKK